MNATNAALAIASTLVTVTHGGETVETTEALALDVADKLVEKHGAGIPQIVRVNALPSVASTAVIVAPIASAAPVTLAPRVSDAPRFSSFGGKLETDEQAKARIEGQHATLKASGVTVDTSQQFFATGTRMAQAGYGTQEARKAEHDAKMAVHDAARTLELLVKNEGRTDIRATARQFADSLTVTNGGMGKVCALDGFVLSEQAMRGLVARIESPALSYLLGIRDRIAAEMSLPEGKRNVGAIRADKARIVETLQHECYRNADNVELKVRARSTNRDMFAVVSPSYVPADAPAVLARIVDRLPSNAKGSFAYDSRSTSWELRADVWTPTPVSEQAVGEAFSGYVSFQSKDNGTGKLNGGGGIILLRCLNASTYTAEGARASRTHRGGIMSDIDAMLKTGLKSIDALALAWGVNRTTPVDVPSGLTLEDAIPGFWRHLLTSRNSELQGVLPGRSETRVEGLTKAFFGERRDKTRLVRSDFAQGWTKYIQDEPTDILRTAEASIGEWLAKPSKLACEMRK